MKVCIINSLYSPYHRGGAEIVAAKMVRSFKKQGHDVFVISTKPLFGAVEAVQRDASVQDITIYRFCPFNLFSFFHLNRFPGILRLIWHGFDMFNLYSYFKIKKIFQKEKPDEVMVHNLTGIGYLIPRLIKKMGIRYSQTMHDVQLVYPAGLLIKGQEKSFLNKCLLTRWWQRLSCWLFNSPDEVRFPSRWLKDFYESRGFFKESEKRIVRNYEIKTENLLQIKKIKTPDKIKFIYIGQVEKHKGVLFLIQVFNFLVSQYSFYPTFLTIVGNGSKIAQAKKLAKQNSNIRFQNWRSAQEDYELLKQADYAIVPSLCYENSPTVILKSLQVKTPVVASDHGGIPELVKNDINGYLFAAGNKQELLKIIEKIINIA